MFCGALGNKQTRYEPDIDMENLQKVSISEKLLSNLEAKIKSRDILIKELKKRDAAPLRRALSLE